MGKSNSIINYQELIETYTREYKAYLNKVFVCVYDTVYVYQPDQPDQPGQTPDQPGDNPSTGDMTWVVAVVAAVAVTGSCVVLKKREN